MKEVDWMSKDCVHKEQPLAQGVAMCGRKIKRIPVGYVSYREVPRLNMDIRRVSCPRCKELYRAWIANRNRPMNMDVSGDE